jgi:hypothetical protein
MSRDFSNIVVLETIPLVKKKVLLVIGVKKLNIIDELLHMIKQKEINAKDIVFKHKRAKNANNLLQREQLHKRDILASNEEGMLLCRLSNILVNNDLLEEIIARPTVKELQYKKISNDILHLLDAPTAKEQRALKRFMSKGGPSVREYCMYGTKDDCRKERRSTTACEKVHFRRIIMPHTDVSLGDCSYLDTCRHLRTCKFVHYEVDDSLGITTQDVANQTTTVPNGELPSVRMT